LDLPIDFEIIRDKKMGGSGSGRTASFGLTVNKCHEFHSIDLAWLRRKKLLNVGHWSSINWSRGGLPTGSIRMACLPDAIRLIYRHRRGEGEWHDVNELVPLIETVTAFGGKRQWFQCISCRRRCRILYGGAYFRCRRCHNLKYETQYEPPFARAATRALKIRERLGGKGGIDDCFPDKPKAMHWRTYDRLAAEVERLQHNWARGIASKFRLFEPRDE
jgi:hypothetical protein